MNRRNWFAALTVVLVAALSVSVFAQQGARREGGRRFQRNAQGERMLPKHPNSHYYNADGSFNEQAGRDAMAELFAFHRYSLGKTVLDAAPNSSLCGDKLWVLDFQLGDFSNVGMGGVFFLNDKEHGYFGHEI